MYLIASRENQVARERKAAARLARVSNVNTIDDEILRHREDGSQVSELSILHETINTRIN